MSDHELSPAIPAQTPSPWDRLLAIDALLGRSLMYVLYSLALGFVLRVFYTLVVTWY